VKPFFSVIVTESCVNVDENQQLKVRVFAYTNVVGAWRP